MFSNFVQTTLYSNLNNLVLEKSVESQQQVIAQQKEDFKTILETNKKLTTLSNNLQKN